MLSPNDEDPDTSERNSEDEMVGRFPVGPALPAVAGLWNRFADVVLGLFNYPTGDVGPDGTHEIDIEFARWGDTKNAMGNYTVWPVVKSLKQISKSFSFTSTSNQTTHRFIWSRDGVNFRSLEGHRQDDRKEINAWIYSPNQASLRVSQQPLPVHINLWLFKGLAPKNGLEVEVIIHNFEFTPE